MPVKLFLVEPVTESRLDHISNRRIFRSWLNNQTRLGGKLVNRPFNVREVVFVHLLIGSESRSEEMLDADVVLLGYFHQGLYQGACFKRLANHQVYQFSGRNSKQVI